MKTKLIRIFMACFAIGMFLLLSSSSPDNLKGDKTKVENLTPPPPPGYWSLTIQPTDPKDTCDAYINCSLEFYIQAATSDCVGVLTTPPAQTVPITWGQSSYGPFHIPDDVPCVEVSIIAINCGYPVNSNKCCTCPSGGSGTCQIKICP